MYLAYCQCARLFFNIYLIVLQLMLAVERLGYLSPIMLPLGNIFIICIFGIRVLLIFLHMQLGLSMQLGLRSISNHRHLFLMVCYKDWSCTGKGSATREFNLDCG